MYIIESMDYSKMDRTTPLQRDIHFDNPLSRLNPLVIQDRNLEHRRRASGIEIRVMLTRQREIDTSRVSDGASILTLESMTTAQCIV